MTEMRAIVKQGRSVRACRVPVPEPGPGEVLIRVEAAGICRTDIYVAQGKLPCADPLILGHEFAGVVASCGSDIHSFAPGDRVAAMPVIPCGACVRCTGGMPECCPNHQFLGVSRHGAFAEYVAVPAQVVHQLPPSLSFRQGAYTEPVCASLAVLKASIKPGDSGLIHGENRIAELTKRVLSTAGFPAVRTQRLGQSLPQETDAYDFIIETQPSSPAFDEMIRAVRPGGRIILKSRPAAPVAIDLAAAVRKEVIFESVSYGTFPESLEFLTRHDLADLLGQTHPLEDFVDIFATDRAGENLKSFLSPGAGDADPGISTPSTFTSTDSAKPGIPVTAPCG